MNITDAVYAALIFLPAGVANVTPILANKVPVLNKWNTPLDFGATFRGKRVFGENKRIRGVVLGTFLGGLTACLELPIFTHTVRGDVLLLSFLSGAVLGAGALLGDAIESFFKRQVGIKPGHTWFPFDQIDYIVGGLALWLPFARVPRSFVAYIFVIYFGLHLVASYIGYLIGLKDRPI